MKYFYLAILWSLLPINHDLIAKERDTYVSNIRPFVQILDVYRQAEAWAACSASYDILETLTENSTKDGVKLRDVANGAKLSVMMSIAANRLKLDVKPDEFKSIWAAIVNKSHKILTDKKSAILADAERLNIKGDKSFNKKLLKTIKTCKKNMADQQAYVEFGLNLDRKGLLDH